MGIGRNRRKLCHNAIEKGLNRGNKRKGIGTGNARNCTVLMIHRLEKAHLKYFLPALS